MGYSAHPFIQMREKRLREVKWTTQELLQMDFKSGWWGMGERMGYPHWGSAGSWDTVLALNVNKLQFLCLQHGDSESEVAQLLSRVWIFATLWTVGHQVPPSVGFPRQEYWSGLPFPSSGYLPDPGIEPESPTLRADTLTSEPPGKPNMVIIQDNYSNLTRVMVTKCVSQFFEAAQWMFNTIIVIVSIPYSQKPSLFINISSLTWGKKHPDNFSMLVPRSLALSSRNSGENC